MRKVYKNLTEDQIKRGVVFSSCLSEYRTEQKSDTIHELTEKEPDFQMIKNRLLDDSFFNKSYFKYNIIRQGIKEKKPTKKEIIEQKKINYERVLIDCFKIGENYKPLQLWNLLKGFENHLMRLNEMDCNGEGNEERNENARRQTLEKVNLILENDKFNIPIFVNTDPRGYALKIESDFMSKCDNDSVFNKIHRDMRGYGILSPDY